MASIETNSRKIAARLRQEGWTKVVGSKHEKYEHSAKPGVLIVVPRHTKLSVGVARFITKKAGWL